jgi:hypothetical protein
LHFSLSVTRHHHDDERNEQMPEWLSAFSLRENFWGRDARSSASELLLGECSSLRSQKNEERRQQNQRQQRRDEGLRVGRY